MKTLLTVPLCRKTNIATFRSAPGNSRFRAFCASAEIDYDDSIKDPIIANPAIEDKRSHTNTTAMEREMGTQKSRQSTLFDLQGPKYNLKDEIISSQSTHEAHQANIASEFLA